MYILEIILEGFKSYSARTLIDKFDPQFNAITGLNGSGKSNILDAICFVMGISQLQHVRAEKLQELIYKQGNSGVTKASVTIVFDNMNKNQSPPGYTEMNQISVTRTIENQKSKYYINGRTETAEKVKSLFCSVKLNVNNPHFLIMQGRVTKVINMKPMEILGLIEEAAGISLYQTKKEQTQNLIKKKDAKLQEINNILESDVNPQLEALRKEKDDYALFKSNENQSEEYDKILAAHEYWEHDRYIQTGEQKSKDYRESQKKNEKSIAAKLQEIEQLKIQQQGLQKGTADNQQVVSIKNEIFNLEKTILSQQLEYDNLIKEDSQFAVIKNKMKSDIEVMRQEIERYSKKIFEIENENIIQSEKELDHKKDQIRDLEKEIRMIKEGKDNIGSHQDTLKRAIQDQETNLANTKNKKNAINSEIKILNGKLKEQESDYKSRESERRNFEMEKNNITNQIQKIKNEIESRAFDLTEFQKIREDKVTVERSLEKEEKEMNQFQQIVNFVNFNYKIPYPQFDKKLVCGKLMTLFRIKDPMRFGAAVEAAAGGKLMNVVVRNERVSKELIQNKCLHYAVTFIPLNVIRSDQINPNTIQRIKELSNGRARLAKELVEYDPEYEPAMNFAFGSIFVADDEETARKVAYNDFARFMCVTVKGDKYNPQGTLEGGFNKQSGILMQAQKYQQALDKRSQLASNLEKLNRQYQELAYISQNVENQKHKMTLLEHELRLKEQRMNETSDQNSVVGQDKLRMMQEELVELNQKLQKTQEKEVEIHGEIDSLMREQRQLKESGGSQKEKYFQDKVKQVQKDRDNLQKQIQQYRETKNHLEIKIDERKSEITNMEEKIITEEIKIKRSVGEAQNISSQIGKMKGQLDKIREELIELELEKTKANQELDSLSQRQKQREDQLKGLEAELKEVNEYIKKYDHTVSNSTQQLHKLIEKNKWIETEREFFGVAGHRYHFEKMNINKIREENKKIKEENDQLKKRINLKVDAMFEKTEGQYQELKRKQDTTRVNKDQFELTIRELDDLKNKEIEKTWKAVDKYCSEIYSTLLQGASAKLVPPEGKTVQEGLELKVGFSGQWKDSLSELSGGQRSLLALSLILALLKYHPAPLYILDEIDSALDLSHTQNIGLMIRKYFQNSQFLIVSLKEGLFSNANVLFKVQFLDNRSQVKRFQVRKNENQNPNNGNSNSRQIQQANDEEDVEFITT